MTLRLHDKAHHNLYYIFEYDKKLHPMPFKKVRFVRLTINKKYSEKYRKT